MLRKLGLLLLAPFFFVLTLLASPVLTAIAVFTLIARNWDAPET